MQDTAIEKVRKYISQTEMINKGSLVLAGVSGGSDSVTMLDILDRLKKEMGFDLKVIHVNHGIRGQEALRDQKTVEKLCEEKKISCSVYSYNVPELSVQWKMGHEEAGRKVRRETFEKEWLNAGKQYNTVLVALAHNKNDLAETMLHHLARGTGIRGLAAVKPVNGIWIRPVLCLERKEIDNYIKEQKLPHVVDSSNLEDEYTRNRIRRHILPLMEKEINEKTVEHMAETANLLEQAETYIEKQAHETVQMFTEEIENGILIRDGFQDQELIMQSYGIREILEKISTHRKDITSVHINSVRSLFECQTGKKTDLPYNMEARRTYRGVAVLVNGTEKKEQKNCEEFTLNVDRMVEWPSGTFTMRKFPFSGEKILEKKYTKWLDCDKIKCALTVRTRRSGDYMVVNQKGNHKKITRCMIDDKIPAEKRDKIPLVTAGEEVLWIVGGRLSESYKITSCTRNVLEIKYQGGSYDE